MHQNTRSRSVTGNREHTLVFSTPGFLDNCLKRVSQPQALPGMGQGQLSA